MKLTKRLIVMAKKHWGTLFIAVVGIIGAAILNLVTPYIVQQMTASLETPEGLTVQTLLYFSGALVLAYLLRAIFRFVSMYVSHLAAWRFVPELTLMVYDKLQSLSMRYYQDKQTGEIMSRTLSDTRQIEVLVAHALPDLISNVLVIVSVAIMLFTINARLALLTLIPVPFVILVSRLFSKKVAPLFQINRKVLGQIHGAYQDNLSGMKEIQAFGQEAREHEKMDRWRALDAQVNIRANLANGLFHPSVEFLTSLGTVIVVGLGGYMAIQGTMDTSEIIGFIMYLSLFYQPLAILARLVEDVQASYAGAVRVFDILDAESEIQESPDAVELPRCSGQITFDHVSFSYDPQEPVLQDVSFTAEPGQMIALVGPTGVGKTTVVSLLERFYDPQEGTIRLDGVDIRGVTLASLRSQISMVLQDVFLFNGTIAENIAYGAQNATQEEIEAAARIAHAHEFICAMPEGYATVVGERGVRLSGGQKQRLSIARAVLRNAPILVLDEATSAVDTETEAQIQDAIEGLAGSRTILVIAHRLSTIMRADQILVLQDGRVAERGTYQKLVAKGGLFARLSQVQWRTAQAQADNFLQHGFGGEENA